MLTLGVSAGFHDAGLTVVEDGEICFAPHSERYSKKKHDKDLCEDIINQANSYMDGYGSFDAIAFMKLMVKEDKRIICWTRNVW